jgi:glycosyltransferase involved in cell wall biosynthesis
MGYQPFVSVIINNHNYGDFLRLSIESALGQTYSEIEVLVVDDGSIDHSHDIISDFDGRVTAIIKANGGQASAFNAGLAECRGDVVIFLDADDILRPTTAERVADVFRSQPDVVKVMYRTEVIDAVGRQTGCILPMPHLIMRSGDFRPYSLTSPFDVTWMATSANAFRTDILRRIAPIPEDAYGKIGADWYISHLAPLFGHVVSLDHVGVFYRIHGRNNFQVQEAELSLAQLRQSIGYMRTTLRYIEHYSRQLGLLTDPAHEILSVSYIASRMVSLKLDRRNHPVPADTLPRLLKLGVTSALRRVDVPGPTKALFVIWFAAMAAAPRPIASWLAKLFFLPATRGPGNRLLGALQRWPTSAGSARRPDRDRTFADVR